MNRIEFMTGLASLLQDISAEERIEAMQYYNDYFDDAGKENEQKIIEELGSPAKVAAEVKEGLKSQTEETGEYRETGYTDTRFEQKESPAERGENKEDYSNLPAKPPRTSKLLKWILIILIIIAAAPIVFPVVMAVLGVILGIVVAAAALFVAFVIGSAAVAVAGIALFGAGIATVITEAANALVLMGVGLIMMVIGVILTVAAVRLCIIVLPGIVRGIVWICRRPFEKRRAVAR